MNDIITLDSLTDPQRSVLDAIVSTGNKLQRLAAVAAMRRVATSSLTLADALPDASPPWEEIESAHGAAVMASLVGLKLIERWEHPDCVKVTLTPSGAALLGVVTEEHWEFETVPVEHKTREGKPGKIVPTRMGFEVPQWQPGEPTKDGGMRHLQQKRRLGEVMRLTERPIRQPKNIMEQPLRDADQIEDKRGKTEYVQDWYDGGATTEKRQAATLFVSEVDGKGWEAEIDPRLTKKPHHRLIAAAKRSACKGCQGKT